MKKSKQTDINKSANAENGKTRCESNYKYTKNRRIHQIKTALMSITTRIRNFQQITEKDAHSTTNHKTREIMKELQRNHKKFCHSNSFESQIPNI